MAAEGRGPLKSRRPCPIRPPRTKHFSSIAPAPQQMEESRLV